LLNLKNGLSRARESAREFMAAATAAKKPRAQFRRATPDERSRQLGEATLRCIRRKGNAGVSARQIAAEAGVTQGLITHYFGEVNELVAYAFDLMSEDLLEAVIAATRSGPATPRERLDAYIEASFSPAIFDQDVLRVWVVFWGLILHSPRMSRSQQQEYSAYVTTIEALLSEVAADEGFAIGDSRLAAIAFNALLDGLWLAWCLNPGAFQPEQGVAACRHWVEGLRRGAHA
jgi:AcrR family transcriptional regulator